MNELRNDVSRPDRIENNGGDGKLLVGPPKEIRIEKTTKRYVPREIAVDGIDSAAPKEMTSADQLEVKYTGGRYSDCKKLSDGKSQEVHHMPSKEASDLAEADGPAITMDKSDHRQTASCGNSKEAKEYREKQKELISQGKIKEAFEMDKQDIRSKFGDKYDKAIAQAEAYLDKITNGGEIK